MGKNSNQQINIGKNTQEEIVQNIAKKLKEELNSLYETMHFNCRDNVDSETKINRIISELDALNSKINKGLINNKQILYLFNI